LCCKLLFLKLKIYFLVFIIISCSKPSVKNAQENDVIKILSLSENTTLNLSARMSYTLEIEKKLMGNRNDSIYRANLYRVANNYFNLYELDKLKHLSFLLREKAIISNDEFHLGVSYMLIGNFYQESSINDSSFYYFTKAEKIFKKINNDKLGEVYYNKGLTEYYCNDYLGSESSLINALRISNNKNLYKLKFDVYMLIAANSMALKNYKESLIYNKLALKVHYEHKLQSHFKAKIQAHIGVVYIHLGQYSEAIKRFELALEEQNLIIKDPLVYTYSIDNLAYSNFKLKNYNQLPQLYFRAAKIRDSLNINQGQNYNRLYLSEYYAAIKDTVKSSQYAHEAYALSKEYKAPNDMLQVLKQLSKIEPQHALKYSNDYIRISDSVYQLERETRNKFAKIAFETEEITQEKDTALTHKSIYSGIALTVFLVGFLIFIIIHQKNKHKEMFFLQQQQKNNDEIYQLIQLQHHKVEEARLIEKQRIAQELHDGIMNKLAYTRFNLHLLTKKNDDKAFSKCATYIDGIQDIEKEIRDIAHDLNNHVFSKNSSFKNALITLFNEQKEIIKAKFHIELNDEINWELLKENVKIHIFRMFQELLQNIAKHAKSNNVIISAAINKEILFLEVYDDGEGFSLKGKKKGIGLQNIYARVKQCGGAINIISNKGQGTKVIIKLPIQKEIKIV